MDLAAVMDEVGDALDGITSLNVYRYPPSTVQPPAAVVTYPEEYRYDETFGRGMDRVRLPVMVMVGKVSDKATRNRIGKYADGAGARSVKAVVEAHTYTACGDVRVEGVEFDVVSMAGVEYLAATFNIDIAGPGGT